MFHSKEVKFSRNYGRRDLHPTDLGLPISSPPFTWVPTSPASHCRSLRACSSSMWPWEGNSRSVAAGKGSYSLWEWGWGLETCAPLTWSSGCCGRGSRYGIVHWGAPEGWWGRNLDSRGPGLWPSADSSGAGLWTGAGVPGKGPGRGVFANHYTRTSTFCQPIRLGTTQIQIPGHESLRKAKQA